MIRVLIADGSAAGRSRLSASLGADPGVRIVGEASGGAEALELAKRLRPDVIAMDVHLPDGGGFETTKEIMIEAPTPIVILSDESDARQVELSILALRAGAVSVVPKPNGAQSSGLDQVVQRLVMTVKAMSQVKVVRRWRERPAPQSLRPALAVDAPVRLIAIAASTGGPAALHHLLAELPADFRVPILVVQHIAGGFVDGLVTWLNGVCSLKVKLAVDDEPLLPHTVYVAPDKAHLGTAGRTRIKLSQAEPIGGFRPSATYLFESVAEAFRASAVHVILTGMGQDGVAGLEVARKRGGKVIAQDEASSIVYGMPGAAVQAGVVDQIMPLDAISRALTSLAHAQGPAP